MKKIFLSILFFSFLSCHKSEPEPRTKQFDLTDLSKLSLDIIDNFWETDSIRILDSYFPYYFNRSEDEGGISLSGKGEKYIGVAVFKSQEQALISMKDRIESVAVRIHEGESNGNFNGKWWYTDNSFNPCIFVNQWNTIIEVSIGSSKYIDIERKLTEIAMEVAKRIDNLSQ